MAFGCTAMPPPTGSQCGLRSMTSGLNPRRRKAVARLRPAMPPPTIRMCALLIIHYLRLQRLSPEATRPWSPDRTVGDEADEINNRHGCPCGRRRAKSVDDGSGRNRSDRGEDAGCIPTKALAGGPIAHRKQFGKIDGKSAKSTDDEKTVVWCKPQQVRY